MTLQFKKQFLYFFMSTVVYGEPGTDSLPGFCWWAPISERLK